MDWHNINCILFHVYSSQELNGHYSISGRRHDSYHFVDEDAEAHGRCYLTRVITR